MNRNFYPDPETEEIVDSHVFLAGDKVSIEIEVAEPVRLVLFRVKQKSKTKFSVVSCKGTLQK